MNTIKGQRITVAGLGVHGGAVGNVRWLHNQGAILTVTDSKPAAELTTSLEALADLSGITWVLGEHRLIDFTDTDMVIRNPALRRDNEYLEAARKNNVPIEMDSSLFFKHSPTRHVVGITGSKGKTSTTHAVAALLRLCFPHVETIGIEGTSPLAALPNLSPNDVAVFELSSWRLEALQDHKISPPIAIAVSLYRDHLNTYASFDEYIDTKKTIVQHQDVHGTALLNYDDPAVRSWSTDGVTHGRVVWYSLTSSVPGDGICVEQDMITIRSDKNSVPLFSISQLPTDSDHARRNMLPAIYLAWSHRASSEDILEKLAHLPALAHRQEELETINEVTYVNDSTATIPDATIAALHAYRKRSLVLILGGSDKQLEFAELATAIAKANIRALVFLPGNATSAQIMQIKASADVLPPITEVATMPEAVQCAAAEAMPGDIVLLSPGATSFGLFDHEFDRGDQYKEAVANLS